MTVSVDAISYAPVQYDYGDDDVWLESTRDMQIDDDVIDIFREYLSDIIYKSDTRQVTVGHFQDDSRAQTMLDSVMGLNFGTEGASGNYDEFENVSESLAQRLINEMNASSSSGILFVITGSEGGEHFIGILKLDLEEEETFSVLDRDTHELESESLQDVLPEPNQLQKGCIYPVLDVENFNLTGDVKFLQKDSPSNYFEEFLGCVTSSGSLDQVRNSLNVVEELKQQSTRQDLTSEEIQEFNEQTPDEDLIRTDDVKTAAENILGQYYDESDFERKMYEEGEDEIIADPDNAPKHVKWTVDEDIEIKVPMSALDQDRIVVNEPEHLDDDWEFIIRGSSAEKDFQQ